MNDYVSAIRQHIGHDPLPVLGASVFVHRGGMLLLQRRADDGTWAPHGGCVEIGETVEAAARRELWEETGLTAGALSLLGVFLRPRPPVTLPKRRHGVRR